MKIMGLQKLTLLDYSPLTACTIFTGGCNLSCPFCHNSTLIPAPDKSEINEQEILNYLSIRKNMLQGVCLTGGEPLLQPDLSEFIKKIKALNYAVKLDTNGTLPDRLQKLIEENLIDYVAMDIKNSPAGYAAACGFDNFNINPIENSIKVLLCSNIKFEFRTTIVKELHTESDLRSIGEWINGLNNKLNKESYMQNKPVLYFLQAFEDSKDVPFEGLTAYDKDGMQKMAKVLKAYGIDARVRG